MENDQGDVLRDITFFMPVEKVLFALSAPPRRSAPEKASICRKCPFLLIYALS